jgi:hypothetical protein
MNDNRDAFQLLAGVVALARSKWMIPYVYTRYAPHSFDVRVMDVGGESGYRELVPAGFVDDAEHTGELCTATCPGAIDGELWGITAPPAHVSKYRAAFEEMVVRYSLADVPLNSLHIGFAPLSDGRVKLSIIAPPSTSAPGAEVEAATTK